MSGRDAVPDLAALVERRLIEAAQRGQRNLPLVAAPGCDAHPADLAELIAGNVDLARISALARAFMALRWDRWQSTQSEATPRGAWPDEAWMALRLACLPWRLDDNRTIPADETIVRRLIAHSADIEMRNGYGGTALESCQWGSLNFRDEDGHYAACAEVLLQAGANLSYPNFGSEAVQAVLQRHHARKPGT